MSIHKLGGFLKTRPAVRDELGQTMVEYVLLLLLIALVVMLAIPTFTTALTKLFTKVATMLKV